MFYDNPIINPRVIERGCIFAAALFFLTASFINAQWLETTIPVPDSLSGVTYPNVMIRKDRKSTRLNSSHTT
jgi:hypothetical protein